MTTDTSLPDDPLGPLPMQVQAMDTPEIIAWMAERNRACKLNRYGSDAPGKTERLSFGGPSFGDRASRTKTRGVPFRLMASAAIGSAATMVAITAALVAWQPSQKIHTVELARRTVMTQGGASVQPHATLPAFHIEAMRVSPAFIEQIKSTELLRLRAYQDLGPGMGTWTIGYGHTGDLPNGRPIRAGDTITEEQADALLRLDIAKAADGVRALVNVPVTQGQFDTLVDFAFNKGVPALGTSTLLSDLNAGRYLSAAEHFLDWTKVRVDHAYVNQPALIDRAKANRETFRRGFSPAVLALMSSLDTRLGQAARDAHKASLRYHPMRVSAHPSAKQVQVALAGAQALAQSVSVEAAEQSQALLALHRQKSRLIEAYWRQAQNGDADQALDLARQIRVLARATEPLKALSRQTLDKLSAYQDSVTLLARTHRALVSLDGGPRLSPAQWHALAQDWNAQVNTAMPTGVKHIFDSRSLHHVVEAFSTYAKQPAQETEAIARREPVTRIAMR